MEDVNFLFGGWIPVARIVVVGTLGYLALVLLLRVAGKRTLAQMNAFDFVVTVALGASFGRIITARNVSVAEAVTAFSTLVVLQYALSTLQLRFPGFARAVSAPPTLLCFRGTILHDALRRERLTEAELMGAVRSEGVGSLDEVLAVVLESNGSFSVVRDGGAAGRSTLAEVGGVERGSRPTSA